MQPYLPLQLYDIEIDRVNKPYLPLAAGDFSVATGWALVVATGAASLAIGAGMCERETALMLWKPHVTSCTHQAGTCCAVDAAASLCCSAA